MGKPFGAAVEVPFLAPGVNPPSGSVWLFPKSDGKWYSRSSAGVETLLGSNASDLTTGTVAIARIPTGTTSVTVALGDHLHTGVYEPSFAAGTTAQYRRGDKTWQTLDKTAVGLANVPNTDATNMANAASGTLATARGGTGITTAPVVGGVAYGASTTAFGHTAAGTAKQVLQSNGAAAPTWATLDLTYLPDAWVKKSARLATTANIDLTTGGLLTIDGVVTVAGDRVLVKNQSTPAQNGIYSAAVSTWTRTPGADTAVEVAGATVVVDEGTQGGQLWHTLFKSTDTLGTTAMNWYRAVDTSMSGVAGGYEPVITAGTTAQYYRGDKTWQTLDKTAVGLANVPNVDSQNATNLTTGTVADARLPARLGPKGNVSAFGGDWNLARQAGWYSSDVALNSPAAGWWQVLVETHDDAAGNLYVTQTAHQFTGPDTATDTMLWRRSCNAGTWQAWYRLRVSEAELDARYISALYVRSRMGLLANGAALIKNNFNFTGTTYVPTDHPPGAAGSFEFPYTSGALHNDELMSVDPARRFRFMFAAKQRNSANVTGRMYAMVSAYDTDGLAILSENYMYWGGTSTTLAVALNPGDTTVTLTSATNWRNAEGTSTHNRGFTFWDYTDGSGYLWPQETYSRNIYLNQWNDGGISGNVITLKAPWAGPAKAAGTKVSNSSAGGTYIYIAIVNGIVPTTWTNYEAEFGGVIPVPGVGSNGATTNGNLPVATASVRIGWLHNRDAAGPYDTANGGSKHAVALVGVYETTAANISDNTITDAKVATANKDGAVGTASMRTLGTGAQQAAAGNHGHVLTDAVITGTLPIAKGGTNSTATPTAGGLGYGTGTANAYTAAGTAGHVVLSGGAGAPTMALLTDANVATANKDGLTTVASMRTLGTGAQQAAAGNHGHALTDAGITGTLAIAKGGTNTTATPTAGGITYGTGTALAHTAAGTAGQFLKSAAAGAPTWNTLTLTDLPDAWVKKSVRAATTANITLSAPQTIDGIAVVAGDRVLVKNQTTTSGNGIYAVAAGAWTRTTDADVAVEVAGATVSVDEGTQGGQIWTTTFKSTDTLGTTGMLWYKVVDTSQVGVSGGVETFVVAGTTSQYWRGDKTWQALFDATLPAALGTAAVGTAATTARRDHVHAMPTAAQVGAAATSHTHVATTDLTATGTKDSTTFLRGDNTWAIPTMVTPQAALIGQITILPGLTAPYGWFLCDGAEYPIATYTELYNFLTINGTSFPYGANTNGSGAAGSTHFRVPSIKGKTVFGRDSGDLAFDVMGETGGAKTSILTSAHIPEHTHTISHTHGTDTHDSDHWHTGSGTTTGGGGHEHVYAGRRNNRVVTGGGAATITDSGEGTWWTTGGGAHEHNFSYSTGWMVNNTGPANNNRFHSHTTTSQTGTVSGPYGTASPTGVPILSPYIVLNYMVRAFETTTPAGQVIVPNSMDVVTPPNNPVNFNGQKLTSLGTPTATGDAVTKGYVDTATMARAMGGFKITGLGTPTADTDAATKAYVDTKATSGYTTSVTPALTAHTWSTSINHALNVTGMAVSAYEVSTGENMDLDWKRVDANNVQLRAGVAMAANSYVLYVTGR